MHEVREKVYVVRCDAEKCKIHPSTPECDTYSEALDTWTLGRVPEMYAPWEKVKKPRVAHPAPGTPEEVRAKRKALIARRKRAKRKALGIRKKRKLKHKRFVPLIVKVARRYAREQAKLDLVANRVIPETKCATLASDEPKKKEKPAHWKAKKKPVPAPIPSSTGQGMSNQTNLAALW